MDCNSIAKSNCPFESGRIHQLRACGEMAATLVLDTSAERRVGSSPTLRTNLNP